MNSGIHTHSLPTIYCYENAANVFAKRRKPRSWSEDTRPLKDPHHGKDHFRIQKGDDFYALYYHRTPVVTFWKGGIIEVDSGGWGTRNTTQFANHFLLRCHVDFHSPMARNVCIDRRCYQFRGVLTLHQPIMRDLPTIDPRTELLPCSVPVVNRKRANAVLRETGFNDFRMWVQAIKSLSPKRYDTMIDPEPGSWLSMPDADTVEEWLKDQDMWPVLLRRLSGNIEHARLMLYKQFDVVEAKERDWLTPEQLFSVRAAQRKYHWL